MREPILIIGNGAAGIFTAKNLRDKGIKTKIVVLAGEKYHYYPRPNLIGFLAGELPQEKLSPFPPEWYEKQAIQVYLNEPALEINLSAREVVTSAGRRMNYSFLVLATGAHSFIPPFPGAEKKGVFTLRTLDDALAIIDWLEKKRKVVVIGGGLLGLETARALKARGAEVEVLEFFGHLLPRQLDEPGASLLKELIEKQGLKISTGEATARILGNGEVSGVELKSGKKIVAETVIIAAGVRPNLELAEKAGLKIDQGVIIDEHCRTSDPSILAAGDVAQFKSRPYGILPAAFDQARVAAATIAGESEVYQGTVPANTLKIVGIDLTSIGLVNPGEEEKEVEELKDWRPEEGIYRKIVLKKGVAVGAIWLGTAQGVRPIMTAIKAGRDLSPWKGQLLKEDFDFKELEVS